MPERRRGRGRGGTSAASGHRPWRWRRGWPAALRRRAGRSSCGRARCREPSSRSTAACVRGRAGRRSPCRAPSRAPSSAIAVSRCRSAAGGVGPSDHRCRAGERRSPGPAPSSRTPDPPRRRPDLVRDCRAPDRPLCSPALSGCRKIRIAWCEFTGRLRQQVLRLSSRAAPSCCRLAACRSPPACPGPRGQARGRRSCRPACRSSRAVPSAGASAHSSQALASAIRWPARLPLSTDET